MEGNQIGLTYPRRAAGLVKKGRAYYVNDFIIRLSMSDAMLPVNIQKSEVMKMDNRTIIDNTNEKTESQVLKLYFEPRSWSFNKECADNVGSRSFMTGPDGVLAEGYTLGNWGHSWTEIVSKTLLLPKNTDCSFTFWLNGGENDRNDEVCRFEVVFNNDYEQRFTYNLNRNYIRPVKRLNGWELYEIPFRTQDNEYTQLRFAAQKAYMTVLAAKDAAAYEGLTGGEDSFEAERPQRHNIVFDDGYPTDKWYGTKNLQYAHKIKNTAHTSGFDIHQMADSVGQVFDKLKRGTYASVENFEGAVADSGGKVREMFGNAMDEMRNALHQLTGEIHTNAGSRISKISANLDMLSSLCDMLENLNVEDLARNLHSGMNEDIDDAISEAEDSISDIADEIRDDIEDMADQLEELRESLSM